MQPSSYHPVSNAQVSTPYFHPGQNPYAGHTPAVAGKKRFKVLNSLERRGLEQRQRELSSQLKRTYDPITNIALLKANLQELESCYQSLKDAQERSAKETQERQNLLTLKDQEIGRLGSDLLLEKGKKQKSEQKLQEREAELCHIQLSQKQTSQELSQLTSQYKTLLTLADNLQRQAQELKLKNESLEQQLSALNLTLAEMKSAIEEKSLQNDELSLQLSHHTALLQNIESLIHQHQ